MSNPNDNGSGGAGHSARLETRACAGAAYVAAHRVLPAGDEHFVSRAAIVEKLEREHLETDAGYSAIELAYRKGHNDRNRSLLQWVKP